MRDKGHGDGSAEKGEPAGAATLLASRRFGPLFWAQFLSAFNDNAVKNALVLMIAYRADAAGQMSAQILIPLAGGLFILPFFLCSATAGTARRPARQGLADPADQTQRDRADAGRRRGGRGR